jgi:hypothetical protein
VRFSDFLKATVLISAAAATALAAVTIAGASADGNESLVYAGAWWFAAGLLGAWLGRRGDPTPQIGRLLADARSARALPELRPGTVLLNRLWALLVFTIASGALAFLAPQIPAIATGFAVIWALYWRRQESAVAAIEERDGVRFYVERTSPIRPIQLLRTPGFGGHFLQAEPPTAA